MAYPESGEASAPEDVDEDWSEEDDDEEEGVLGTALTTRHIEAFSRKVTTTAGQLIGPLPGGSQYQSAMTEIHRGLHRPNIQRSVFSFAQASPAEIVRSKLSTSEIQSRALAHLPDELLSNIPKDENTHSLFQGFQATLPEADPEYKRHRSREQRLLEATEDESNGHPNITKLKNERRAIDRRLDMMGIRKNMCSSEIREIDSKIVNLNRMREIVLDRLANLEHEEIDLEHELEDFDNKIEALQEEFEDAADLSDSSATPTAEEDASTESEEQQPASGFMSESIYQKLPTSRTRRKKGRRRPTSMPILHEHFSPGSKIKELEAHSDVISALDFDYPFGTLVTSALDDTVRVWDLNRGRCIGLLEGHHASVRCLQVEDNLVATGSADATIRLWDLSRADYTPHDGGSEVGDSEDGLTFGNSEDAPPPPPPSTMQECPLFTLSAHVDEVTALHFRKDTLVSGSADKTLRQWDLTKGRCVQTLDVLWAAAQASASLAVNDVPTAAPTSSWTRPANTGSHGRVHDASADFVGALQVFDAALACGTADGMVRLWDLRSGQVHRSLVGHTGPVTALKFDDTHLVTGSLDKSIRIWDLRTGTIHDAYAYDHPITDMHFDTRRIVAAAGEDVVKVYDKTDGHHWDCGEGMQAREEGKGLGSGYRIERCRVKDGFLVEGRRDGTVGVWSC
ncbi:MAG: Mitochondrial fission protein [Cirrosporium novae-zelandiae]|nr:MAG: Mitochondrial fission protein [Cirrosporium novae-zelandiae]KAI9735508.1 MAG: Mitochondrial fission protein [Cirrosporium novae-zelandiae]